MGQEHSSEGGPGGYQSVVDCGTSLDITQAERLCGQMRLSLDLGRPVLLDTSSVQRVDFVGIHLLSAFLEQAQARGLPVRWPELGRCLEEAAELARRQLELNKHGLA